MLTNISAVISYFAGEHLTGRQYSQQSDSQTVDKDKQIKMKRI